MPLLSFGMQKPSDLQVSILAASRIAVFVMQHMLCPFGLQGR